MALSPPQFTYPESTSRFENPVYVFFPGDSVLLRFESGYAYEMLLGIVCGKTALSFSQSPDDPEPQDPFWINFTFGIITLDVNSYPVSMPPRDPTSSYFACRFTLSESEPDILRNGTQSGFFWLFDDPSKSASSSLSTVEATGISSLSTTNSLELGPTSTDTTSFSSIEPSRSISVIPFLTSTTAIPTSFSTSPLPSEPPPETITSWPSLSSIIATESASIPFPSSSSSNGTFSVIFPNTTTSSVISSSSAVATSEPPSAASPTDDNIFHGPIIDPLVSDPTPLFDEVDGKTIIGVMAGVPGLFLAGIFGIFCYRLWECLRLRAKERAKKKKENEEAKEAREAQVVQDVQENPDVPRLAVEASGALPIPQVIRNSVRRDSGVRSVRFELDGTESGLPREV